MNVKNFEFLRDGLKYMGFGEKLNADLETQIKQQPAEFQLKMVGEYKKEGGVEKVNYELDFKKSDQTDMYFFNRYKATLGNDDPAKENSQTFYITKNAGITAKEAYNLLSGRSVNKDLTNKEGQPFNAWLKLDFTEKDKYDNFKVKQFTSGYGYELDKVLDKFPIKELADAEQKDKLMKSLAKGNLASVTFQRDGKEDKMFVEANPQFKTLTVYDASMKKMYQENDKKEAKQETTRSSDKKETLKVETGEEDSSKKKTKKRGVGV